MVRRIVVCADVWRATSLTGVLALIMTADATLGFAQCTFNAWDAKNQGNSALIASAGRLLVQGCDFQADLPQIELGAGVSKAVILGNMIKGSTRITNASPGKVMIGYNADDS